MLKILGKSTSINVRKVLWTCAELELPYSLEQFGSGTPNAVDTPDFLHLNPNGMVPVLIDSDTVLWESNTICRYLANRYQVGSLLPQEAGARAQVEKWMDWQATELNNSWRYAFMATVRHSPHHDDPVALAASVAQWNRMMEIVDAQLQKTGAYIAGAQFSLADIVIGLSVNRWQSTPIAHSVLPAVAAYQSLLAERVAYGVFCANGVA